MFESDDFDQVLSQLDLPEPCSIQTFSQDKGFVLQQSPTNNICVKESQISKKYILQESPLNRESIINSTVITTDAVENQVSPKHIKRKIINSYFDHKSKRKFPGPAGLLNGTFEESNDDSLCQVELLSQDIDYTQSYLHKGIFESPLWVRLLEDTKHFNKIDSIKSIKSEALKGNLRPRKAESVTAYVESVDRSAIDPLIVLRDTSENIKCTLHRDAWVAFSSYIVSECCALVLCKPTVLTTGSAFKKHYLNITLSNIYALYSSYIFKEENESFPNGFIKVYDEDYTIIKNDKQNSGINVSTDLLDDAKTCLDGLDGAFSDEIF